MKKCENPKCFKEVPDSCKYCGEACLREHLEFKKQAKQQIEASKKIPNTVVKQIEEIALIDPNEGTKSKTVLKNKALKLIVTYPDNLTLKQYASRLCWDISVSFRTALEGYIEPMVEKGILLHIRENLYKVNPNYRKE